MPMKLKLIFLILLLVPNVLIGNEIQGQLIYRHEFSELKPCGSERSFWLIMTPELAKWLKLAHPRLVDDPDTPVYVDLDGRYVASQSNSFAEAYAGPIQVNVIVQLANTVGNDCRTVTMAEVSSSEIQKGTQVEPDKGTYVFVCDDNSTYTVRATASQAWVFRAEETLHLPLTPMETRHLYSDGTHTLHIEGEQARLGKSGSEPHLCRNDRRRAVWEQAKRDGADFRAVGNEPGWHLEILQGELAVLVTDYGASRVALPLPAPKVDGEKGHTRWENGDLIIDVTARECHDSMSGEGFETEVLVTWGGRSLKGCGRALH